MPKFWVEIPEAHYSLREVEADTAEEALELAGDMEEEIACEYSHTLEQAWRVRQLPDGDWKIVNG